MHLWSVSNGDSSTLIRTSLIDFSMSKTCSECLQYLGTLVKNSNINLPPPAELAFELQWPAHPNLDSCSTFFFPVGLVEVARNSFISLPSSRGPRPVWPPGNTLCSWLHLLITVLYFEKFTRFPHAPLSDFLSSLTNCLFFFSMWQVRTTSIPLCGGYFSEPVDSPSKCECILN